MSKKEIYQKNQKIIKTLGILTPIAFWLCVGLGILCLFIAFKNSFGNLGEIIDLLDNKKYNGEQLSANYAFLIAKYGEWVIGKAESGFSIVFINLKNAVFNGFMIMNAIFSLVFFITAFLGGKWLLPLLKKKIETDNQDMVNLTILDKE